MDKTQFDSLMQQLQERIDECKKYFENISTEEVLNRPLKEVQALKEFVQKEYPLMSKILMVDLYHILGMGDLNAIQTSCFIKAIKEYSDFRPNMNAFKDRLETLYDVPEVPVRASFHLEGLKGVVTKGEGVEVVMPAEFPKEDFCEWVFTEEQLPIACKALIQGFPDSNEVNAEKVIKKGSGYGLHFTKNKEGVYKTILDRNNSRYAAVFKYFEKAIQN